MSGVAEILNDEQIYSVPLDELLEKLGVKPDYGLTEEQVRINRELYGKNELKKVKRSFFKVIIAPIINLLIIIYLASAFAMWLLGEVKRTVPTFIILGFNAIVAIIQQMRAEKQLKALRKLSAATSTVIREGKEVVIPSEEIVVGDIVKLKQGDKIPADCRLIEAINLSVDESTLTGESVAVLKKAIDLPRRDKPLPIQDQKNMVFLGTFVSVGRGLAVVVRVGQNTELGKINVMLEESTTGDIPLRKKMNNLAKILGLGVLILLTISIIHKVIIANPFTWEQFRIDLINSIDLGLKIMPINLPMLTTIVLLTGVLAMAKYGVIVREISRTETLGRVSVVCTDKTGTLTKNEMTAVIIWTPDNREYGVSGFGYEPKGIIYDIRTGRKVNGKKLEPLIISGYLNNNARLKKEIVTIKSPAGRGDIFKDVWYISGLPTEGALIVLGKKYNDKIDELVADYEFVHEFAFDSSIKRMSKVFRNKKDGKYYVFTKGAPEWILPLCNSYLDEEVKPMDEITKAEILQTLNLYAAAGYRILAICMRVLNEDEIPENWDDEGVREEIENKLTFLGLVVILDPPREDVAGAIEACKNANISVVMITGDNLATGVAIASQLGIFDYETDVAIEGKDLELLADEDFPKVKVFARVSPEHKQIIVERYQKLNRVVSMSGDGVNDALALSLADCGLAMGMKGTEVAKEAADMVITDDSFSTIVAGIEQGRGLFEKIRVIIYFFVCISVMEAIILFSSEFVPLPGPSLFDYWQLNLLYITAHAFPSLGFTFMPISKMIMEEEPRDSAELLDKQLYKLMAVHILLMGSMICLAYFIGYIMPISEINRAGTVTYPDSQVETVIISANLNKARTMAFVVLFLNESVILPLQIRRMNLLIKDSLRDVKEIGFYIVSIAILIFIMYTPEFQQWTASFGLYFYFMELDPVDWLICILLVIPNLIGFDLVRKKWGVILPEERTEKLKRQYRKKIVKEEKKFIEKLTPADEIQSRNTELEDLVLIYLMEKGPKRKRSIIEKFIPLGYTPVQIARAIEELMSEGNIVLKDEKEEVYAVPSTGTEKIKSPNEQK